MTKNELFTVITNQLSMYEVDDSIFTWQLRRNTADQALGSSCEVPSIKLSANDQNIRIVNENPPK